MVDRLGDVIVLLQQLGGVKRPERPPTVPRPDGAIRPAEMVEPPKMSGPGEIRAFFSGDGVKVAAGDS